MSDRLDRALAVIDVGLQRAGDVGYGSDNGLCVRCQLLPAVTGSSWCIRCPGERPTESDPAALASGMMEALTPMVNAAVQHIEYLAETAGPIIAKMAELKREMDRWADPRERAPFRPFTCHRHGAQTHGFCRVCSRRRP